MLLIREQGSLINLIQPVGKVRGGGGVISPQEYFYANFEHRLELEAEIPWLFPKIYCQFF